MVIMIGFNVVFESRLSTIESLDRQLERRRFFFSKTLTRFCSFPSLLVLRLLCVVLVSATHCYGPTLYYLVCTLVRSVLCIEFWDSSKLFIGISHSPPNAGASLSPLPLDKCSFG